MIFSVTFMIYILDIYNPAMFVVYGAYIFVLPWASKFSRPACPAAKGYTQQ